MIIHQRKFWPLLLTLCLAASCSKVAVDSQSLMAKKKANSNQEQIASLKEDEQKTIKAKQSQEPKLIFASHIYFQLPKAKYFPKEQIRARQNLSFQYKDKKDSLTAVVEYGPNGITAIFLNNMGIRGLTASWDGHVYKEEKHEKLPNNINGKYILFDILTLFGSDEMLKNALTCQGEKPCVEKIQTKDKVIIVDKNQKKWRQYSFNTDRDMWNNVISYQNLYAGYSLNIRSQRF